MTVDTMEQIAHMKRRLDHEERDRLEYEREKLRQEISAFQERDKQTSMMLIEEKTRSEFYRYSKEENEQEVKKLRDELGRTKRRLTDVRRDSLPNGLLHPRDQIQEVIDLKRQLGETSHRLQKRTDETRALADQLAAARKEIGELKAREVTVFARPHGGKDEKQLLEMIAALTQSNRLLSEQQQAATQHIEDLQTELASLRKCYEESNKAEGQLRADLSIEKMLRGQAMRDIEQLKQSRVTDAEKKTHESTRLREELARCKDKVLVMERQIKTLHVEYREELAELTKKLAAAQREPAAAQREPAAAFKPPAARVSFEENRVKQLESALETEAASTNDEDVDEYFAPKKRVRIETRALIKPEIHEPPSTPRIGMMRHEIAHRFKSVWMPLKNKTAACSFCSEPLSAVSFAAQCKDCRLFAHLSCSRRMGKTCGLPADFAQMYVDAINQQAARVWTVDRGLECLRTQSCPNMPLTDDRRRKTSRGQKLNRYNLGWTTVVGLELLIVLAAVLLVEEPLRVFLLVAPSITILVLVLSVCTLLWRERVAAFFFLSFALPLLLAHFVLGVLFFVYGFHGFEWAFPGRHELAGRAAHEVGLITPTPCCPR
ncbi:Citron Rho-interacting kinase [Aphelenchoides fujianensis]|nr:Citron Rho-interacting kinase [Aphelenchoides fujianensis]